MDHCFYSGNHELLFGPEYTPAQIIDEGDYLFAAYKRMLIEKKLDWQCGQYLENVTVNKMIASMINGIMSNDE